MPKFNYQKLLKSKKYGNAVRIACESFYKGVERPLTMTECLGECYMERHRLLLSISELTRSAKDVQPTIDRIVLYGKLFKKYEFIFHGYEYCYALDDPDHKPWMWDEKLQKWVIEQ